MLGFLFFASTELVFFDCECCPPVVEVYELHYLSDWPWYRSKVIKMWEVVCPTWTGAPRCAGDIYPRRPCGTRPEEARTYAAFKRIGTRGGETGDFMSYKWGQVSNGVAWPGFSPLLRLSRLFTHLLFPLFSSMIIYSLNLSDLGKSGISELSLPVYLERSIKRPLETRNFAHPLSSLHLQAVDQRPTTTKVSGNIFLIQIVKPINYNAIVLCFGLMFY